MRTARAAARGAPPPAARPAAGAPAGAAWWVPRSPCGPGCRPRGAPAVGAGRLAARLGALLAVLAATPLLLPALASRRWRGRAVRTWSRAVLRGLGVRLAVRGAPPARATLVVANHISWLDVVALLAVLPSARLVAKREVRGWPVVGWLAGRAGTLFLERDRPRALPAVVAAAGERLRAGAPVACFPEGTTWCGPVGGRFRPALFQAAVDAGVAVLPVRVGYRQADRPTRQPAFVGSDTFAASLHRIAATPALTVTVSLRPTLYPAPGATRRTLSRAAEAAVHAAVPVADLAHLPT
ncbi:hypothetical protein GCM10010124_07640 [Pilimelia terevasa]|uniref:Phospholipid/glycerol acyltransferase domain-containing protein n=1 Tax=Pilimelia terevasa TaxID=53372 RepID=A0A8J3BF78_9ACTN|nr:lysophospholipid acyltransferase family protein [Pilimelia terevasa]GGK17577.1 hypothetical protein GCM10010124_07640 [Pilimelia terevasa]